MVRYFDLLFTATFIAGCLALHYKLNRRETKKPVVASWPDNPTPELVSKLHGQMEAARMLVSHKAEPRVSPSLLGHPALVGKDADLVATPVNSANNFHSWYSKCGAMRVILRFTKTAEATIVERRVTYFQHVIKRGQNPRRNRVGEQSFNNVIVSSAERVDKFAIIEQTLQELEKPSAPQPEKLAEAKKSVPITTTAAVIPKKKVDSRYPIEYKGTIVFAGQSKRQLEDKSDLDERGNPAMKTIDDYQIMLRDTSGSDVPIWGAALRQQVSKHGYKIGDQVVIINHGMETILNESGRATKKKNYTIERVI